MMDHHHCRSLSFVLPSPRLPSSSESPRRIAGVDDTSFAPLPVVAKPLSLEPVQALESPVREGGATDTHPTGGEHDLGSGMRSGAWVWPGLLGILRGMSLLMRCGPIVVASDDGCACGRMMSAQQRLARAQRRRPPSSATLWNATGDMVVPQGRVMSVL